MILFWEVEFIGANKKGIEEYLFECSGCSTGFEVIFCNEGEAFFEMGKKLYDWTKEKLQDPSDYLYYDNLTLDGQVNKTKFPYNAGQMLQASVLLYNLTKQNSYLEEAQRLALACSQYFFENFVSDDKKFRAIKMVIFGL